MLYLRLLIKQQSEQILFKIVIVVLVKYKYNRIPNVNKNIIWC